MTAQSGRRHTTGPQAQLLVRRKNDKLFLTRERRLRVKGQQRIQD